MKKQIIILNGTGGSGKDTFINLCSRREGVVNSGSYQRGQGQSGK